MNPSSGTPVMFIDISLHNKPAKEITDVRKFLERRIRDKWRKKGGASHPSVSDASRVLFSLAHNLSSGSDTISLRDVTTIGRPVYVCIRGRRGFGVTLGRDVLVLSSFWCSHLTVPTDILANSLMWSSFCYRQPPSIGSRLFIGVIHMHSHTSAINTLPSPTFLVQTVALSVWGGDSMAAKMD